MRIRPFAVLVALATLASCGSDGGTTSIGPAVSKVVMADVNSALVPGKTVQLVVFAFNASGTVLVNPGTFAWSSSAPSVATISQTGVLSAVTAGSTVIAAALGGVSGAQNIVVSVLTAATKDTVYALPNTFVPNIVNISVGQAVTFVFAGAEPHNAIFRRSTNPAGSPTDILIVTNQVLSRMFSAKGTFNFDCTVHPGMTGQVVVQ